MKIGVLGTGVVGQTIAGKLASLGHDVMLGTRDPKATAGRTEKGMMGNPSFSEWHAQNPKVKIGTFTEAAKHSELAVSALNGAAALSAFASAGTDNFTGKVVLDIANPLDFSKGMPPSLSVANTDSLGEQLQRALPGAKVVKSLNTVNAYLMVDPQQLAGGDHTMFVCGNDAEAKGVVTRLLREGFGWKDIIDLGDISMARGTEMYLPLWVRLYGALNNPMFSIRVVR